MGLFLTPPFVVRHLQATLHVGGIAGSWQHVAPSRTCELSLEVVSLSFVALHPLPTLCKRLYADEPLEALHAGPFEQLRKMVSGNFTAKKTKTS